MHSQGKTNKMRWLENKNKEVIILQNSDIDYYFIAINCTQFSDFTQNSQHKMNQLFLFQFSDKRINAYAISPFNQHEFLCCL